MTHARRHTALLLQLEFPTWATARPWTYSANFAVQEGLTAAGVDCLTVPVIAETPCSSPESWLFHARRFIGTRRFDQVWVWLVHSPLDAAALEWIAGLAPVRVGILMESLRYDEEDYTWAPHLRDRLERVEQQLRYFTHVLAPDERDAEDFTARRAIRALWWPPMVPERFITLPAAPPRERRAVFHGTPYGPRRSWVAHPSLTDRLLYHKAAPATRYHRLFDELQQRAASCLRERAVTDSVMQQYVRTLQKVRLGEFQEWMAGLPQWPAIVNLPSLAKFYGGRVFEGMAAGRPVISWTIGGRPRNLALFEQEKDILLFPPDDPDALARHIDRLRQDGDFARSLATNAQQKLRCYHTAERRVLDTLHWIETGAQPSYGVTASPAHAVTAPDHLPTLPSEEVPMIRRNTLRTAEPNQSLGNPYRSTPEATTRHPQIHPVQNGVTSMPLPNEPPNESPRSAAKADAQTSEFYTNLFVNSPYWSTPHPNPDEAARWTKIASFLEYILRRVRRQDPTRQLKILDVGCGRGWLTNLATMYGTCEGIEPVAGVIDHARKLFPHLRFEAGTAESVLRRPDFTPYDVVLTSEVIEHVPHGQKETFLAQLAGLLKPDGYVILTTPRGEMWEQWKAIAPPNQPVEDWVTEDQLRALFTAQGFRELGLERVHVEIPNLRYIPAPTPADIRSRALMPIYQVWACQRAGAPVVASFTRPPMVSVIVPTCNRPDRLREALRSVLAQTYRDFEIIVVNDGTSDIDALITELNSEGRITCIRHDRNRGLAAARNTGIRAAKGKYMAYLDDDDRYLPGHLDTLVTFLEQHDCKAAYTDAWRVHETLQQGRYVETGRDLPYSHDFNPAALLISNFFPVLCVMHERACLDDVGLFDESLFAHEDWDLWIRMATKYPFTHIKQTTAEFTWRTDGSSMTSGSRETYRRTTEIIYRKYQPYSQQNQEIIQAQRQRLQTMHAELQCHVRPQTYDCSIVIPVFNKMELTVQCLTALAEATGQVRYEVILVDNGSSDGTGAFLRQLGGDVRIITNAENLGFAKACNQGARIARGKYVVFLNNDTIPLQGWLNALVAEAEAHPEVGIVGSKLLFSDGTIQHAGVVFMRTLRNPYHIYRSASADVPAVNQRREFQAVTAACMLIRREVFEEVNGFDEGFINGFEDVDLCLQVREKGYHVIYQPRSVVYHLESQTPGRNDRDRQNARLLQERWGAHWWLGDEDLHYHTDGFKLIGGAQDVTFATQLKPMADVRDRAAWAHVAAAQAAALKKDWTGVKRELHLVDDWPNDRFVLSWGAMVAERLQETASRIQFLSRYLALVDAPGERLALARTLLERKDVSGAEEQLRHVLASTPDHAEGLLLMGVLSMQREQYREAEQAFSAALRHGADRRKCLMGMGMASLGQAYHQGAWERFLQVLSEHPDDPEAVHWLLRAGTAQNRWQELSRQLRTYLSRNPADLAARFALAGVLIRAEQIEAARREYESLRALAPTYDGLAELGQAIGGKEAVLAMEEAHS
jgi:GT2 family glycosyltransferase/SAM-dependent methyltransferase/thioredoxin-like negative regulator of GroEL